MTKYFESLRIIPWNPKFKWIEDSKEAADLINQPHEDYPIRVNDTFLCIIHELMKVKCSQRAYPISPIWIKDIHKRLFNDKSFAGMFRDMDVVVGNHRPPKSFTIASYMMQLKTVTAVKSIDDLTDWYYDFETIHPFQDGNGRVGGVVLSVISSLLEPKNGYLAPLQ